MNYKGPVVVIVMDGVGLSDRVEGNAEKAAYKPVLDRLYSEYQWTKIKAHGTAVCTCGGKAGFGTGNGHIQWYFVKRFA